MNDEFQNADPSNRAERFLRVIEEKNPAINAYVCVTGDLARSEAAASTRRYESGTARSSIDGWCAAVKDNIDVAGVRTANGLPGGEIAQRNAPVVDRLSAAGAVVLGKTNLHEAALGTTTVNPHWGATHNPHRAGYTAGGSSGGSAAAVAAGLCDFALGTDTMGSVRLPAAYCGIVGFKPSFGVFSNDGVRPLCWSLDHVGVLASTVERTSRAFHALAGAPENEAFSPLRKVVRLAAFDQVQSQPAVQHAFDAAIATIERHIGACSSVDTPAFDAVATRRAALLRIEADAAAIYENGFDQCSPALRAMLDYGANLSAPRLAKANEVLRQSTADIARVLLENDLIVAPTAPQQAFPHEDLAPSSQSSFLGAAVLAGAPAISIPLASDGLPVGLQLIAAPGKDQQLLVWAQKISEILSGG